MKTIENKTFDEERALYDIHSAKLVGCRFDGEADGESALKECSDITAEDCYFNLRYPMWHVDGLKLSDSMLTENCRAALWYSSDIKIANTGLHGIKALRECHDIEISDCDIVSPEFGWSSVNIEMNNTTAVSEYFMLRAENLRFNKLKFSGKYSFQYISNAEFENCTFDTKDAFWHGVNITVKNSVVKGEYLGWYSKNLTFINCKIIGTQPLCYCEGLKLVNCEMTGCDFSFEKSDVDASVTTPIDSVRNIRSGKVTAPAVGEIIRDNDSYKGEVVIG